MTENKNNYMVWPPISENMDPETMGRVLAMLSWFAGPSAKRLAVPIVGNGCAISYQLPVYASLASMSDRHKLGFLSVREACAALEKENYVLLVLDRDVDPDKILAKASPLHGSQILSRVERPASGSARHRYYYLGNPDEDLQDAYHAVCLTYWVSGGADSTLLEASQEDLSRLQRLAARAGEVALFGTGPSLSEALDQDHSASFNIVCNTIIKNTSFTARLDPQLLIASDAHFHFSYHRYSARFLADVVSMLDQSGASFYTFDKFAAFLRLRVPEIAHRVFGLPAGRERYGFDFDRDFRLFPGESVLNMFMLPLASFLGDEISLNGFTGRAPDDSYFWSHSELHQYVELMEDVRQAHPAFFTDRDYGQYANTVDDDIALRVNAARAAGIRVRSNTTSFYSALQE